MNEKAKFPTQDELDQFQEMLAEIGIKIGSVTHPEMYHILRIELKYYHDGERKLAYQFYVNWQEVLGSGTAWWSDYHESLKALFAAIISKKIELQWLSKEQGKLTSP